jgi:hypothetical protein
MVMMEGKGAAIYFKLTSQNYYGGIEENYNSHQSGYLVLARIQTGFLYPTSLDKYRCHKCEICAPFRKTRTWFYF